MFGSARLDFDLSCKKQVANISFDGKYWYLSYTEDIETSVTIYRIIQMELELI